MKKTVVASVLLMAALAMPNLSSAAPMRPGPYFSGFIGVTVPSETHAGGDFNDTVNFDPGLNIGGTAGMDFGTVRLEGEVSYKEGNVDTIYFNNSPPPNRFTNTDVSLNATAFMANMFIDLHNNGPITPYLGGGIGFAILSLDDKFGDFYIPDEEVVLAYQAGGGLEVALNRQMSLDLGYRYFRTDEANFADTKMRFESHNATVGLRIKF
ncbi:outer membrane protein [Citrifermentans bremense]|uniref:outer membrane protein n=1 Tax=Citrifermentans bremense TaxID=60035 RepID=UPI0004106C4E|nr:outer membrane beta-barrel protein [Citrifermentans bremense]